MRTPNSLLKVGRHPWIKLLPPMFLLALYVNDALWAVVGVVTLAALDLVHALVELRRDVSQQRAVAESIAAPTAERLTAELAELARVRPPELLINSGWDTRIASFNLRAPGSIAIDGGALRALSEEGLRGMIAHELGHIVEPAWLLIELGYLAVLYLFARAGQLALMIAGWHVNQTLGLLAAMPAALLVGPMVAWLLRLLQRHEEDRADAFAVRLVGVQPLSRGLAELDTYDRALVALSTLMERANPRELPRRLSMHAGASGARSIDNQTTQRLLDLEAEVSALYDRNPLPLGVLQWATDELDQLLREVDLGPRQPRPKSLARTLGARLAATHRAHADRLDHLATLERTTASSPYTKA